MPDVVFSHPEVDKSRGPLVINTGADEISWSFGLNTQTYPTYAGEVVQILSVYLGDLTVGGTSRNYTQLEQIYSWFLYYMEIASNSGTKDLGGATFNQTPVTFRYDERGWVLHVMPTTVPGFRLSQDTVAPQWQVVCRIIEDDGTNNFGLKRLSLDAAVAGNVTSEVDGFLRLNAGIGFDQDNPFINPQPGKKQLDNAEYKAALKSLGDYFTTLIPAYASGDFNALASTPAFGIQDPAAGGQQITIPTPSTR